MVRPSLQVLTTITACAGVALMVSGAASQTSVKPLGDPSVAAWARPAVTALSKEEIIRNNPDGLFHGERVATRAVAFVVVLRLERYLTHQNPISFANDRGGTMLKTRYSSMNLSVPEACQDQFKDIDPTNYFRETYYSSLELQPLGVLQGDPDGFEHFRRKLTRAELASMLSRLMSLLPKSSSFPEITSANSFADAVANPWWKKAALAVQSAGIVSDDENGAFQPNGTMTRNELAVYLQRVVDCVKENIGSGKS
jgi:hypothetical protein